MHDRWRLATSLPVFIAMVVVLSAMSSLPAVYAPPNPITWVSKAPIPYRTAQAGVVGGLDGRIYVMSGYSSVSPSTPVTTARAYDPRTDTWSNLTSLPTPTRGPGIAVDASGLIYVISGYSGSADITNNQVFNVTSNTWTAGTGIPTPVWMPGATTGSDGRIYVVGGETSAGTASSILQIYNTRTKLWSSGASMSTARKQFQAVAGPNGLIYAIGGMTSGSVATATVEAYNVTANTWTAKASLPSAVMVFGATLGPDGLIYVFGGSNSYSNNATPYFNTVYSYDPTTDTWYTNTQTLPTARRELSAATSNYNGRMYVMGGANGGYLNTNEEATLANGHTTITTVTCHPATVVANNATSCGAIVTDTSVNATTPTGTVTFLSSGTGTFSGTCPLSGTGTSASCTTTVTYTPTIVGTGIHIIRGTYSGDATHNPSTSIGTQSFTLTVTARSTATNVSCAPSSVVVNNGSTCTATVTDTATAGTPTTPTGTVSFTLVGTATGSFSSTSCNLSSGSCSVIFTPSSGGTLTVTGNYGGDGMHAASSGTSNTVTSTLRTTSITISCHPTSIVVNNSTICTVTITDTSPAPALTPIGTVTLSSSGTGTFATCTLSGSGVAATCSTTYTPTSVGTGSHMLTAHYEGDTAHFATTIDATMAITVTERTTATSVSCGSPATIGTATSCTVTVTDNSVPGTFITPTGTVTLTSSGTGTFTGKCTLSGATAFATCSVTYTPTGTTARTDNISANYPGDNNHGPSGSFQLTVNTPGTPNQPPVASIVSITPNPAELGQTITFVGSGTDSDGTIVAYNWRSSISLILSSQASFQMNGLPAGTHTIYFSVEDNQGAWSQEVSLVLTITSSTTTGSSPQAPGWPTYNWILLLITVAGVGVTSYGVLRKRQKRASSNPPVVAPPSAPSPAAPPGASPLVPPEAPPTAAPPAPPPAAPQSPPPGVATPPASPPTPPPAAQEPAGPK